MPYIEFRVAVEHKGAVVLEEVLCALALDRLVLPCLQVEDVQRVALVPGLSLFAQFLELRSEEGVQLTPSLPRLFLRPEREPCHQGDPRTQGPLARFPSKQLFLALQTHS